jgi:hypothetical protein
MIRWRFRTYVDPRGKREVQAVIDAYDPYGREAFSRAVAHLAVTPKAQWHEPQARKLRNEDPLYEIRYKANRRQERALGWFLEEEGIFVIVLICNHKDKIYVPPDAFGIAKRRIAQIRAGVASSVPLEVDGEHFPPDDEEF